MQVSRPGPTRQMVGLRQGTFVKLRGRMGSMHGFTDVDAQANPTSWVNALDRLAEEPFYRSYQQKVRELLCPMSSGRYLEVGAGTGLSAAKLATDFDLSVITTDLSQTMSRAQAARGLRAVVTADAEALPFRANVFDGAWADRTMQHVLHPLVCLGELIRVVRPGGRVVLADPDHATQGLAGVEEELSRLVLTFRADRALRNGRLAHRHAALLIERGLSDITVETRTAVVRDPVSMDNVWGLRSWARSAAGTGMMTAEQADAFEAQFDEAVTRNRFAYTVTFFITAGTVSE